MGKKLNFIPRNQASAQKNSEENLKNSKNEKGGNCPEDQIEMSQLTEKQFIKQIKLKAQKVSTFSTENLYSAKIMKIVLKNEKSFMVVTNRLGVKLINNRTEICSTRPLLSRGPTTKSLKSHCFYSNQTNRYYIHYDDILYTKKIDKSPLRPYPFIFWKRDFHVEKSFYSKELQRLVIELKDSGLIFLNLKTRKLEFDLKHIEEEYDILDYCLCHKKMLVISQKNRGGLLFLLYGIYNTLGSRSLMSEERFDMKISDKSSIVFKLAESPSTNQSVVLLKFTKKRWYHGHSSLKRHILSIFIEFDEIQSIVDFDTTPLRRALLFDSMVFYRLTGDHALFVSYLKRRKRHISFFDFDLQTDEMEELREKQVLHKEEDVTAIEKLGDDFYYTGTGGNLMKLSLSCQPFKK